ncbi:MAG: RagB/SusD family nutrient uptake outer membrane protein, partial [Bacteroidaceae bacterium]|nr:RagB/SusD family nutrient uptake outer membrane protein [Bacteroidaceae bacterium]
YLCDLFGRVPIVLSPNVPLNEVQQSPRSEVFHFAFDELQAVAPMLPAERSNREGTYYGRITRPVAWFLLAKLALNAEVFVDDCWTDTSRPSGSDLTFRMNGTSLNAWQTCMAYCDSLTRFGYQLEPLYASNFAIHNEASTENIFTIPMDKMLYANQYCYLFRSRHYNHGSALGLGAENGSSATRSAMLTYGYGTAEADSRMTLNTYVDTVKVDGQVIRLDDGSPLVYMPLQVAPDLSGSAYEKTGGARMAKYEVDRTAYSDGKLQENDIVLFRYADVLLMKAEALMRQGLDGSAEFDAVRQRAGMPVRPLTEANLLAERLMELHWEGWRRQDMVRFGCFHLAYDLRKTFAGEETAYTTVFPIPGSALELNQKLSQNDGYPRK